MNYLSIDVGTSRCKYQLFSERGEILSYEAVDYGFYVCEGVEYVDVKKALSIIEDMIRKAARVGEISSIAISSLGESFVLLGDDDEILFMPMPYTDGRGDKDARDYINKYGLDEAFAVTGAAPHSMFSIYKLAYIRRVFPDVFAKAKKVMLIGDYLGYKLTGIRAIDYSLAARTGAFDITNFTFDSVVTRNLGFDPALFSVPMKTGETVGKLSDAVCKKTGLKSAPLLVLGGHDQVCATLGAGAIEPGDASDGLGTVECMTVVSHDRPTGGEIGRAGYTFVPFPGEKYCAYLLNYSCGSAVSWFKDKLRYGDGFFEAAEKNFPTGVTDLYVLPYFAGAATPFADNEAKAAIIGATLKTDEFMLYKGLIEGLCLEMRLNAEYLKKYGVKIASLTATGGGSNSPAWLKLKANVQKVEISRLRSAEGGLCGLAMLQAVACGGAKNLKEAKDIFVVKDARYYPDEAESRAYDEKYEKYKSLYNTIKNYF